MIALVEDKTLFMCLCMHQLTDTDWVFIDDISTITIIIWLELNVGNEQHRRQTGVYGGHVLKKTNTDLFMAFTHTHLHTCMHTCTRTPACMCTPIHAPTYTHTHAHKHARMHARTHARTRMHARTYPHRQNIFKFLYICIYIYILYKAKCCIGRPVHIRPPTGDRPYIFTN